MARQRFRLRPTWSWQGLVAFILANSICGGITILALGTAIAYQHRPLPENIGGMLTAIISALIGSVATFLGRIGTNTPEEQQGDQQQQETPDEPTDTTAK